MQIYSIAITRHSPGEDPNELLCKNITADQAIDLLLQLKHSNKVQLPTCIDGENRTSVETISTGGGGATGKMTETEDEDERKVIASGDIEQDAPPDRKEDKPKTGSGKNVDWDVDRAELEIQSGMKPKEIAELVGTSLNSIYQLKYRMKQNGELEENDPPVAEVLQNRITDLINSGKSDQEIINQMSASMSNREIEESIAWAKKNES
jgi:hypothetical protein